MSSYTSEKIYDSEGHGRYMQVTGTQTTNGSSANTSTINWTLTVAGNASSNYDTGATYLWIAGVERYYKARTSWSSNVFPAKAGSVSGSFTLSHKDDGTIDPIEVKFKTAIFIGEWNSTTKTGTWTLDKINRYFTSTPTVTLSSVTETKIVLNWSTSETCSAISWSGGGSKVTTTGVPGTSGTVTFENLSANTTYNIYGAFTRSDSGLASNSATISPKTYDYPYITKVETTNLTIGGTQKFTLYNPLGRTVVVKMYTTGGTLLGTANSTATTSASLTPVALDLYKSIPNSQSANCYYSAVCSNPSSTKNTSTGYTYKITGNEKPTLNIDKVLTYDSVTSVTSVTGQTAAGGWLVQGLSKLKVAITEAGSVSNKTDGSSISKYEVTFAGSTKTLSVGSTGQTWDTFNGTGSQTITVKVTDSRQLSTSYTKTVNFVAYRPPTISASGSRIANLTTPDMDTINLAVNYSGADVNGSNGVKVRWSGAGRSGYFTGSDTDFDSVETGTKTATLEELANNQSYAFSITITDKFNKSTTVSTEVPIGEPIMFIDTGLDGVGVNCLPEGKGLYVGNNLRVNGKRQMQRFTMDLSGLSTSTFYPVIFDKTDEMIECEVYSRVEICNDPWNQNSIRFSLKSRGWSDTPFALIIKSYANYSNSEITIGCIGTGNTVGNNAIWLRGGLKYHFFANIGARLEDGGFNSGGSEPEIFTTGSNYEGGTNTRVSVMFRPQSTISSGAYFYGNLKTSGNLTVSGTTTSTGKITSNASIEATGGAISASTSLFANGGYLYSVANGKTIQIGSQNSRWCHYDTSAPAHYFNKKIAVTGTITKGSGYNLNVPAVFIQSGQPSASQTGDIWFVT